MGIFLGSGLSKLAERNLLTRITGALVEEGRDNVFVSGRGNLCAGFSHFNDHLVEFNPHGFSGTRISRPALDCFETKTPGLKSTNSSAMRAKNSSAPAFVTVAFQMGRPCSSCKMTSSPSPIRYLPPNPMVIFHSSLWRATPYISTNPFQKR
jgi:hypothetical protein